LDKLINLFDFWIERLSKAGSLASDTEEQRLRKAVLIFLAVIYTMAGIVWGSGYLLLGLPVSGSIPLSYSFISAASLLYFFKTKHYTFFCRSQLTLILVLPFLLQWSLGGLTASGALCSANGYFWPSNRGRQLAAGHASEYPCGFFICDEYRGRFCNRFYSPKVFCSRQRAGHGRPGQRASAGPPFTFIGNGGPAKSAAKNKSAN
jgi:hypothetical protein